MSPAPKRDDLNSSNPVEAGIKSGLMEEHGNKIAGANARAAIEAAYRAAKAELAVQREHQQTLNEKGRNVERERQGHARNQAKSRDIDFGI